MYTTTHMSSHRPRRSGSRPIRVSIPTRSYTEPHVSSTSQSLRLHGEELVEMEEASIPPVRAFIVRALALLCACSLSVGSH